MGFASPRPSKFNSFDNIHLIFLGVGHIISDLHIGVGQYILFQREGVGRALNPPHPPLSHTPSTPPILFLPVLVS